MTGLLQKIVKKSPWIYRINAGSCNGCDVEMATTALIPRYDVERLGCKYCGSPKHADIVLISGPVTAVVKDKVYVYTMKFPTQRWLSQSVSAQFRAEFLEIAMPLPVSLILIFRLM